MKNKLKDSDSFTVVELKLILADIKLGLENEIKEVMDDTSVDITSCDDLQERADLLRDADLALDCFFLLVQKIEGGLLERHK